MDAFDRFWQWAKKPVDSPLTIPAELHYVVMRMPKDDRGDRRKVNEAVRDALLGSVEINREFITAAARRIFAAKL